MTNIFENGVLPYLTRTFGGFLLMAVVGIVSTFGIPTAACVLVAVGIVRVGGLLLDSA